MKGLKVSPEFDRNVRKGFAVSSLHDLRLKVSVKLEFNCGQNESLHFYLPDGTEIDDEDYFESLPSQTFLVASKQPFFKPSAKEENPLEHFLSQLRWNGGTAEVIDGIRGLFLSKNEEMVQKWTTLTEYAQKKRKRIHCSSIKDDPDWFKDISTNAKTKEEYLTKGCQARIRGYLAKAESGLKTVEKHQDVVAHFRAKLKLNSYYGHYFDRSSSKSDTMCDKLGQFLCEGRFDADKCHYYGKEEEEKMHIINPYESPEARIMFSTWNLDHVIERSRSIVPALIKAITECQEKKVVLNVDYFHDLLFTRKNLKLVHIVCHDKQEHLGKKCDPCLTFVPEKKKLKNCSKAAQEKLASITTKGRKRMLRSCQCEFI